MERLLPEQFRLAMYALFTKKMDSTDHDAAGEPTRCIQVEHAHFEEDDEILKALGQEPLDQERQARTRGPAGSSLAVSPRKPTAKTRRLLRRAAVLRLLSPPRCFCGEAP